MEESLFNGCYNNRTSCVKNDFDEEVTNIISIVTYPDNADCPVAGVPPVLQLLHGEGVLSQVAGDGGEDRAHGGGGRDGVVRISETASL